MSHRLNLTSEIDLRVSVLSGSADENFLNYSELIVSVKKNSSSIYRRVLLNDYDKRVDVDFENTNLNTNSGSVSFFQSDTDYTILVKLVGANGNSDVDLVETFQYQERPESDFTIEITSTSNYENMDTPGQSPTPNMTIKLSENSNTPSTLFEDVINVNLIMEQQNQNMLETFQIPVEGRITKDSPIYMYFNKKIDDLSYNKLVLELSGNAFSGTEQSSLEADNVLIRDIPSGLISTFGEVINVHITLETEYGTTDAEVKSHKLSRTPNTADLGTLYTNTTSTSIDLSNVFLEFNLNPNSVDVNSKVPKESQVAKYLFEVSGNNLAADISLEIQLEKDMSGNYLNELKVKIDASGVLTAEDNYGGVVSGTFTGVQLLPLNYYGVKVKAFSNVEEGYSDNWAEEGPVVLEKLPTLTITGSTFGTFFNNNVDDYKVTFNYNATKTILDNIKIRPKLHIKYYDSSATSLSSSSFKDEDQDEYNISNDGNSSNEFFFDISNNLDNEALLANMINITTTVTYNFVGGEVQTVTLNTENTTFKTLEVVYPDHNQQGYGLTFADASLNSTSDDKADGFKLTLQPSTEIFEFRDGNAPTQEYVYNSLTDTQKSRLTTNIDSVDISYTINNTAYGVTLESLADYSSKYIFDVSKEYLGYDIQYYATLNNDRVGTADVSERQLYRYVRINDVRQITTSFIDNTFSIDNKRGYTLDIAVLKNLDTDELEILADGVNIDKRFSDGSTNGNQVWTDTITYTDSSGISNNTDLLVSLEDQAINANGKKEVFVLSM